MLVFPIVCMSCGAQMGTQSLLYMWLRNAVFGSRPDNYAEAHFKEIAEIAGITNPCCWSIAHGTLTHADLAMGVKLVTSSGLEI